MTNEALVAEIQRGGEGREGYLAELCRQNHGLVVRSVKQYSSAAELEDLIQEGYIGLMAAADSYNPEKGAAFSTYAVYHIKNAVLAYLRECGQAFRLPPDIAALMIRLRWIQEAYQKKYGLNVNAKAVSALLGISREKAALLLRTERQCKTASLYAKVGEDEDLELQDVIRDPNSEKRFEEIFDEDTQMRIWQAVDSLPEEMRTVIRGHYKEGQTLEEIGSKLGISSGRIKTTHYRALQRLRRGRVLWELQYGSEYNRTGYGSYRNTNTSAQEWLVMRAERWSEYRKSLEEEYSAFGSENDGAGENNDRAE